MRAVVPILIGLVLIAGLGLAWLNPDLVTGPTVLMGAAGLIVLGVLLPRYETHFYAVVVLVFFWAGTGVPFQQAGLTGRWPMLAAAAIFGVMLAIRRGRLRYEIFHLLALFAVLAAGASVAVSVNPTLAGPKALSLFMLFLYCAIGMRLSFAGRELAFAQRLVLACEGLIFLTAVLYFVAGYALFGNPNSLGAVVSVVLFPVVLWGWLLAETRQVLIRRGVALFLAALLIATSSSRASLVSVVVASGALLWALRRYRLLTNGILVMLVLIAGVEAFTPGRLDQITAGVLYKNDGDDRDLLQSRRSVWDKTMRIIEERPLLGSGFGTSVQARGEADPTGWAPVHSNSQEMEHGSSYLSMIAWLGLLGVLPFVLMLLILVLRMGRVYAWLRQSGNARHAAVPITLVLTAGLVNVVFEDWLLAVGYYLTIIFWTFAFLLIDLVPSRAAARAPQPSAAVAHAVRA